MNRPIAALLFVALPLAITACSSSVGTSSRTSVAATGSAVEQPASGDGGFTFELPANSVYVLRDAATHAPRISHAPTASRVAIVTRTMHCTPMHENLLGGRNAVCSMTE
jgi:hypothetical protein